MTEQQRPRRRRPSVTVGVERPELTKVTHGVRHFKIGEGVEIGPMRQELTDMVDVLLGRTDPPIQVGILTLQEVANAYLSRAIEMSMRLKDAELEGIITKGSKHYRFRTGPLRDFIDLAKGCCDLGSRRVTALSLELQMKETDA